MSAEFPANLETTILSLAANGQSANRIANDLVLPVAEVLLILKDNYAFQDRRKDPEQRGGRTYDKRAVKESIARHEGHSLSELTRLGNFKKIQCMRRYIVAQGLYDKWKAGRGEKLRIEREISFVHKHLTEMADNIRLLEYREEASAAHDYYLFEILAKRIVFDKRAKCWRWDEIPQVIALLRAYDVIAQGKKLPSYVDIGGATAGVHYSRVVEYFHRSGRQLLTYPRPSKKREPVSLAMRAQPSDPAACPRS